MFIVCRFLRCIEKFDDYGNEISGKPKLRDPQSLPVRNEVTMGKVLFNFHGENDNELGAEEGDVLVLLDVPENSNSDSEWLICLGPRAVRSVLYHDLSSNCILCPFQHIVKYGQIIVHQNYMVETNPCVDTGVAWWLTSWISKL